MHGMIPNRVGKPGFATAFRFAVREMRGGLKGFYIFLACIALGVGTIAGVNSLARGLQEGIAQEGQTILGGDAAFSLVHREVTAEERAFLADKATISTVATMRAMARKPDGSAQTLVEIKAIDNVYPHYGEIRLEGGGDIHDVIAPIDGVHGAAIDLALLVRLDLNVGDRVDLGEIPVRIAAIIANEPDKIAGGVGFGPRLMMSIEGLRATGLVQPGSLVRWRYRLKLPTGAADQDAIKALSEEAKTKFPQAGWRIRSRDNASPRMSRSIDRFAQFLTLVGLTALIVGGVGVANAVRAYLDSKREVIATFKCLGAPGGFVFTVYLLQIGMLAGLGIAIGLVIGILLPIGGGALLRQFLPLPVAFDIYPVELALAVVYGLLSALAFTLWPLGRARETSPTALFRDRVTASRSFPRIVYIAATGIVAAALATLAIVLADSRNIAVIYVVAVAASFVLLQIVARAVMWAAARAPRSKTTTVRLAVGNIHRPGALTPSVVLSLGLGLALLVALSLIDGNLRRQITSTLPDQAPSFFFIDIQNAQAQEFDRFVTAKAERITLDRVPMLRGRVAAINGIPADQIKPDPEVAWALRGDRGITYSPTVPQASKVIEGEWWPADYAGEPLLSMEDEIANGLGLTIGDTLTVNVLGRNITARIANIRTLEWESMNINFVMVFSPNTFAGAPHTHLATVTWKDGGDRDKELALLKHVTGEFPTVTAVRVREALDAVNAIVSQLAWAIRGASGITLIASILVLGGALAAGHRHRIYDAVILKTLGATRARLVGAYGLEYLLLGSATALFGLIAGSIAAWYVLENVMSAGFEFLPTVAVSACLFALALTLGFGLFGTWRILGRKSAPVLRNL